LYTRYPGRMRDILSEAAATRAKFYSNDPKSQVQSYLRSNMENNLDEKNLQKYWGENNLKKISSLDRLSYDRTGSDSRNIFSSHPPFNFIIKHGVQEGSVTTMAKKDVTQQDGGFETIDRIMSMDHNDRLIQKSLSDPMDIVLQSIHLLSMGATYQPGGAPLMEAYQFLARDMYVSDGTLKDPPNTTIATTEQKGSEQTPSNSVKPPPTEEQLLNRKELSRLYDTRPR